MKFESLQGPDDEEQGKSGQRVWCVPKANRTRLPNIYGTSTMCQAQSFAPYLHELIQQGAMEVGSLTSPLADVETGAERG